VIPSIITDMNKIILITIALWVLLLGPGLCIAGVIDHICNDCVEETTCGHEDNCDSDPCVDDLQITDSVSVDIYTSVVTLETDLLNCKQTLYSSLPNRENLPRPESGLPLLN
jgi:hypothetical protein